jgi:hypothetical protein
MISPNVPNIVIKNRNLFGKAIIQISASYRHICLIADDFKAYCFGFNG